MDRKIERQKERAVKDSEPRLLSPAEKEQLANLKVGRAPFPIQEQEACPNERTDDGCLS